MPRNTFICAFSFVLCLFAIELSQAQSSSTSVQLNKGAMVGDRFVYLGHTFATFDSDGNEISTIPFSTFATTERFAKKGDQSAKNDPWVVARKMCTSKGFIGHDDSQSKAGKTVCYRMATSGELKSAQKSSVPEKPDQAPKDNGLKPAPEAPEAAH